MTHSIRNATFPGFLLDIIMGSLRVILVFVFLTIINGLELVVGFILRMLAVFLAIRIYILFTRGLIFGMLIALLIVWRNEE